MERLVQKRERLQRRVQRTRLSIRPKSFRARMVVNRSNRYISVQIIDDAKGTTLCAASTQDEAIKGGRNKDAAKKLGELIAARAKEKGITKVVLDRRGRLYHGRIAAFAEAAREKGLEF
ncbi:MAG: 50S ribosomal protein L18 [Spirochaetia bacterium]|nr:50S ribosomal protein L18 [Spirochaetia bacterium]